MCRAGYDTGGGGCWRKDRRLQPVHAWGCKHRPKMRQIIGPGIQITNNNKQSDSDYTAQAGYTIPGAAVAHTMHLAESRPSSNFPQEFYGNYPDGSRNLRRGVRTSPLLNCQEKYERDCIWFPNSFSLVSCSVYVLLFDLVKRIHLSYSNTCTNENTWQARYNMYPYTLAALLTPSLHPNCS